MHIDSSKASSTVTHWQLLQFLWRYMRPRWWQACIMLVMLLISMVLLIVNPFFFGEAVDVVSQTSGMPDAETVQYVTLMICLAIIFAQLHFAFMEGKNYFLTRVDAETMRDAHLDVFAHVQRLSTQFHINTFAGSTARKIGRGTDAIERMIDSLWLNFLPLVIMLVGLVIATWFIAPVIAVALSISIFVYITMSVALNMLVVTINRWRDRQDTRVTGSLVDAVTGNATAKGFGQENHEDARHAGVIGEWSRRAIRSWNFSTTSGWFQSTLMSVIQFVLLILAVRQWSIGAFTPGDFVIILMYNGRLWGFMRDIGRQTREYVQAAGYLEEMVELFHHSIDVADAAGATPLVVQRGAIAFDHVSFRYSDTARQIFDEFSVTIQPGENIALVGHSGGGKSTFVKLLQRLYDIQRGQILIDGQDIAHVTQQSLRQQIALVPQDPILFHRSLAENIRYAHPDAPMEAVLDAAKKAHAHEFISKLPDGYDTLVGERGVKLSGGERQRVAIARAILADCKILILDEATSSLDSQSEQYIQEALAYLMERCTSIIIAHRLSTIKTVDRILVIEGGAIVEQGSHAELVEREGGTYRELYELQAGGFLGE